MVFGRVFDNQVLDMFEATILSFEGDYKSALKYFDYGTLPSLICLGDVFETNPVMTRVRNYFTDFFSPFRNEKIFLDVDFGLQLVVTLVGLEDQTIVFSFSRFDNKLKTMTDLGIKLNIKVGRNKIADDELFQEACKELKLEKKKKKTIELNEFGETMGRVYVRQQDIKTLMLKRIKKKTGKKRDTEKKNEKSEE